MLYPLGGGGGDDENLKYKHRTGLLAKIIIQDYFFIKKMQEPCVHDFFFKVNNMKY